MQPQPPLSSKPDQSPTNHLEQQLIDLVIHNKHHLIGLIRSLHLQSQQRIRQNIIPICNGVRPRQSLQMHIGVLVYRAVFLVDPLQYFFSIHHETFNFLLQITADSGILPQKPCIFLKF